MADQPNLKTASRAADPNDDRQAGQDDWLAEYFVVEDQDLPDGKRLLMARIAGPFPTADEARAERDRLQERYPERYADVYCMEAASDPRFLPEGEDARCQAVSGEDDQPCWCLGAYWHPLNGYHAALLCPEHQAVADAGRVRVRHFAMREDVMEGVADA